MIEILYTVESMRRIIIDNNRNIALVYIKPVLGDMKAHDISKNMRQTGGHNG